MATEDVFNPLLTELKKIQTEINKTNPDAPWFQRNSSHYVAAQDVFNRINPHLKPPITDENIRKVQQLTTIMDYCYTGLLNVRLGELMNAQKRIQNNRQAFAHLPYMSDIDAEIAGCEAKQHAIKTVIDEFNEKTHANNYKRKINLHAKWHRPCPEYKEKLDKALQDHEAIVKFAEKGKDLAIEHTRHKMKTLGDLDYHDPIFSVLLAARSTLMDPTSTRPGLHRPPTTPPPVRAQPSDYEPRPPATQPPVRAQPSDYEPRPPATQPSVRAQPSDYEPRPPATPPTGVTPPAFTTHKEDGKVTAVLTAKGNPGQVLVVDITHTTVEHSVNDGADITTTEAKATYIAHRGSFTSLLKEGVAIALYRTQKWETDTWGVLVGSGPHGPHATLAGSFLSNVSLHTIMTYTHKPADGTPSDEAAPGGSDETASAEDRPRPPGASDETASAEGSDGWGASGIQRWWRRSMRKLLATGPSEDANTSIMVAQIPQDVPRDRSFPIEQAIFANPEGGVSLWYKYRYATYSTRVFFYTPQQEKIFSPSEMPRNLIGLFRAEKKINLTREISGQSHRYTVHWNKKGNYTWPMFQMDNEQTATYKLDDNLENIAELLAAARENLPSANWTVHYHDTEHTVYWYNTETNVSVWTKPVNDSPADDPSDENRESILAAARENLPSADWTAEYDPENNRVYWYNSKTNVSVWTKPVNDSPADDPSDENIAELLAAARENLPSPDWKAHYDDTEHRVYWLNTVTSASSWTKPVNDSPRPAVRYKNHPTYKDFFLQLELLPEDTVKRFIRGARKNPEVLEHGDDFVPDSDPYAYPPEPDADDEPAPDEEPAPPPGLIIRGDISYKDADKYKGIFAQQGPYHAAFRVSQDPQARQGVMRIFRNAQISPNILKNGDVKVPADGHNEFEWSPEDEADWDEINDDVENMDFGAIVPGASFGRVQNRKTKQNILQNPKRPKRPTTNADLIEAKRDLEADIRTGALSQKWKAKPTRHGVLFTDGTHYQASYPLHSPDRKKIVQRKLKEAGYMGWQVGFDHKNKVFTYKNSTKQQYMHPSFNLVADTIDTDHDYVSPNTMSSLNLDTSSFYHQTETDQTTDQSDHKECKRGLGFGEPEGDVEPLLDFITRNSKATYFSKRQKLEREFAETLIKLKILKNDFEDKSVDPQHKAGAHYQKLHEIINQELQADFGSYTNAYERIISDKPLQSASNEWGTYTAALHSSIVGYLLRCTSTETDKDERWQIASKCMNDIIHKEKPSVAPIFNASNIEEQLLVQKIEVKQCELKNMENQKERDKLEKEHKDALDAIRNENTIRMNNITKNAVKWRQTHKEEVQGLQKKHAETKAKILKNVGKLKFDAKFAKERNDEYLTQASAMKAKAATMKAERDQMESALDSKVSEHEAAMLATNTAHAEAMEAKESEHADALQEERAAHTSATSDQQSRIQAKEDQNTQLAQKERELLDQITELSTTNTRNAAAILVSDQVTADLR